MITTFTGKNAFALKSALAQRVASARSELGDMGVERLDAQEVSADTIIQAVQSLPFLVPKKCVIVLNVQSNAALMDRLEELIERTPEQVDVVLVGPVFDKRKNSFKLLQKHTKLEQFSEPKPHELPSWVVQTAQSLGVSISVQDATYLVDRIGPDQMILHSELHKMSVNGDVIRRDTIDSLTEPSPQSVIFDLLDAAFSGNSRRAVTLFRMQRQQRVEPHYILAMLTWQLHALALAVFANPATESVLVQAGLSPFTARKSLGLAKKIGPKHIRSYISDLALMDTSIKTNANADAALELYILSLAR